MAKNTRRSQRGDQQQRRPFTPAPRDFDWMIAEWNDEALFEPLREEARAFPRKTKGCRLLKPVEIRDRLEAGRYDPTMTVLARLAPALGVPVGELLE